MQPVSVTPQVWERVLAIKAGTACLCCGTWTPAEREALNLYGTLARPKAAQEIFAQIGQSLDGRIATISGDAKDVSGIDGLVHLHRLRALADAVVIGVNTALHDEPRLTVRLAEGDNPARVVIDPDGRLPDTATVLREDGARRIIIQAREIERPLGVEVITLRRNGWIAPRDMAQALSTLGFKRIMIEGGGITIAQFLEAGLLSRLHVAIAPLLIGAGPQGLTTTPVMALKDARRPETATYRLGTDTLFDCLLGSLEAPALPHQPASPAQ